MINLRHPNVLIFLGVCTEVPDICIVCEYMERGSLYDILHDSHYLISDEHIRKFCMDTAKGMSYLHQERIIHRDLKSHNLLVDQFWKCKVSDFGLSRRIEDELSGTMTACGTPCWTAPEVLNNEKYGEKADVYSFAICLWEMCTREEPYHGRPPFRVVVAVATEGLRPTIPDDCNVFYRTLMTNCWSAYPDERPSFDEILDELEMVSFPSLDEFPTLTELDSM